MDRRRSFRWAGAYFGWTALFALVGVVLAGAGGYYALAHATPTAVGSATVPLPSGYAGLLAAALVVVGFLVYRLGKAWAFYRTLTGAMAEELAETYDTERVKSGIVSVLDDRLSDMQQDLNSVNRELRELKREREDR